MIDMTLLISALSFAAAGGVLALSSYVVMWAGLISFATVAFAAVGAFTATWFMTNQGVGGWTAMLIGLLVGAVAGLIVGLLLNRLSSHWLGLATLTLVLIARVFVVNAGEATGGSAGEVVVATVPLWQLLVVLAIVCAGLALLARSRFGVAAGMAREDPAVAASLGVHVKRIHIVAFCLSGAIGGLGGVLQATQLGFIGPDTFYVDLAVTVVASAVLGGPYHWFGPVVGAIVFTGLPVYISQYISTGQSIINGVLLLAIILWLPGGLIDPIRWRVTRAKRAASRSVPSREIAEMEAAK